MTKPQQHQGFSAHYRCFRGCDRTWPLETVIYTCDQCGGLLEVAHDTLRIRAVAGEDWQTRFDTRWRPATGMQGSGVWRYREWVLPDIPDSEIVSLGEGSSALQPAPALASSLGLGDLYFKQCGVSHTGSFKDLGMSVLVSQAQHMQHRGTRFRAVACASTGDTSAALAAYCAAARIPALVLLPAGKVTVSQLLQPVCHGAATLALDTDFDGCMRIVRDLAEAGDIYLANSMNPLRIEGQKTVAFEICQQLGWEPPDWIAVPGGNLGNISALAKGISLALEAGVINRKPRLLCAQAERANPLYKSFQSGFATQPTVKAGPTNATAIRIGDPVSFEKAVAALRAFDGVVEQANENELAEAAAEADRAGLFVCPQTAVALAAVRKAVAANTIQAGERVVVVSTAHGLKFTEFKEGYHRKQLPDIDARLANPPVHLPATADAVRQYLRDRHDH